MRFPDVPGMLTAGIQRIKTSSILAPLLALIIIVGAISLFATLILQRFPVLVYALWTLFILLVLFAMRRYSYWENKDPQRLQSEDYQIEHQRLLLIGDERDPKIITIAADSLTANNTVQGSGGTQ